MWVRVKVRHDSNARILTRSRKLMMNIAVYKDMLKTFKIMTINFLIWYIMYIFKIIRYAFN